jgi:hypothetical protein
MSEYLLGQRQIKCHKEYRPVDGVEAQYILTYHMNVAGPILLKMLALLLVALVGIIAKGGDIVAECIYPNVYNVLIVEIHGNAPLEGGTGNAKILQTCL